MTITEIMETGMINDTTQVIISKPTSCGDISCIFRGVWYQDHILDFFNSEITGLKYDAGQNKIRIEVKRDDS